MPAPACDEEGPGAGQRGKTGEEDGTDLEQHGRHKSEIPKRQGKKECVGLKREQDEAVMATREPRIVSFRDASLEISRASSLLFRLDFSARFLPRVRRNCRDRQKGCCERVSYETRFTIRLLSRIICPPFFSLFLFSLFAWHVVGARFENDDRDDDDDEDDEKTCQGDVAGGGDVVGRRGLVPAGNGRSDDEDALFRRGRWRHLRNNGTQRAAAAAVHIAGANRISRVAH